MDRAGTARPTPDWDQLGFGFLETDVIYRAHGRADRDPVWDQGELTAFEPVSVSPAAAFFSYGLGIFEGLKAQRSADGRVLLFRHHDNARRFQRSAERLLLAPFPTDQFIFAIESVVQRNRRFVPPHGKGALYLRPLQHAIDPRIGISPGAQFWVLVFGIPVGGYFAGKSEAKGESGLKLRVLEQGRVAAGGTGASKCIGNYAGGIALAHPWHQKGYNDVMYLDARHQRYITETSGSNIFVRLKSGKIVTPPLDDQILPGITRDSVIRLAREVLDLEVEERSIPIEEVLDDAEEVFCCGTAWTVLNVRQLDYRDGSHKFDTTEVQQALLGKLLGIQRGDEEDRFGWITEVPDDAKGALPL